MRAQQITELSGPDSAMTPGDVPEPDPTHFMTNSEGVVVDVRAAGVSFPEVLQTRGEYQLKPPLPFVPAEHHFKPSVIVMFVHASDDIAAGQAALAPFRALATPLAEGVHETAEILRGVV